MFPTELWHQIRTTLADLKKHNQPLIAAFDADGTLWDTDIGENFFRWQIENKCVPLPESPWKHYRHMKESGDPRPAYAWLAQINAGHHLKEVREWAEAAYKKQEPVPVFSEQQKLIEYLIQEGVTVYIVTASIKWSVEPGGKRLGIPHDQVIGVETQHDSSGLVTCETIFPVPWREGKAEALLKKTNGHKPFLVAGNTPGDQPMMELATHISLAVGACPAGHELYETEERLRSFAKSKSWWVHSFI